MSSHIYIYLYINIFYAANATFKQQDPEVFSCKHQPKRNIRKIMGQNKTSSQILHSACGKPKKNTISARHCSAADVLKTTQIETTLAVP